MIDKKTENKELEQVACIWYLVTFKDQTEALLDSGSEVNVMNPAFASQLGLKIWKTNVRAQKIDGTTLETYRMVISTFFISDKNSRERFFEKNFLLAEVKPEIVLGIPFLTMSNADVVFQARDFQWKSYTTGDVLPTTRQVKLIGKKEFAAITLDPKHKPFAIHLAALSINSCDNMHPSIRI